MRYKASSLVRLLAAACGALLSTSTALHAETTESVLAQETAIFAGGCFWCMQQPFDKLDGVLSTTVGYAGGHQQNPTYEQVSAGRTGHAEVVKVVYEPARVSYEKLLAVFWHNIDPTTPNRQFCDSGSQYRTAVYYLNDKQKQLAEASKAELDKTKPFKAPIVTEITAAGEFYAAEDYHQSYYMKNPVRYKFYRYHCGRDQRLEQLWQSSTAAH